MMDIMLSPLQVSDLFFNSENPNRRNLYLGETDGPTDEQVVEATVRDATEFAMMVGEEGNQEYIDWLTNDFLKRV